MPKRKRSESVNNWLSFGDCEISVETNSKQQTDEELKAINELEAKQTQNKTSDTNQTNTDDESQLKDNCEPKTISGVESNCEILSVSSDENSLKLRRKSNRISKPIQRSIESTTTANNANISLKKIVKQNNLLQNVSNCESEKPIVNKTGKSDETNAKSTKGGKSLRKLQMWTNEDTKCFFEAISEHGKDFPSIQSYMAQRCERKGIPKDLIKNYEQVRHYYYRMWHKIANSLNINEFVDKNIQEIYGLINYGEIWKKFGSKFDNKLGLHLQQLVNFGHTVFKVKGKSVRVKTPICKALKKIHKINVSENTKTNNNQNLLNLPKEVCIELHPANNESWLRVHSLSQNPRVRTRMSLQKRLSTLVEYLEKRWNQSRIRDSECRTLCGTSLPDSTHVDEWSLRVRPHSSGDLNNVSLSKSLFNSQMDLSLTAYLKTLYNDELKGSSKKSKTHKNKDNNKESNSDSVMKSPNSEPTNGGSKENGEQSEDNNSNKNNANELVANKSFEMECKSDEDEPIAEAERSLSLLRMLEKMNEMSEEIHATDEEDDKEDDDQNKEEEDLPSPETSANVCLPEPPSNATLAQWLSGKEYNEDIEEDNESEKKTQNANPNNANQISLLSAERARKGWSLCETGSMTIGELYLLFRCPKTVLLEYFWEPKASNVNNTSADSIDESVVASSDETNANKEEKKSIESEKQFNSDLLSKLLLAANLSLMNIKRPANTSSAQTQKKRRIKPTPAPAPVAMGSANNSSQLLSSVISNTIFNDNTINSIHNKNDNSIGKVDPNVGPPAEGAPTHNFVVPTSPAPKAVNKTKGRNVCNDPALIQEALRQLQTNKYTRRQRRPTPKPVFGQNKLLLPRGTPNTTATATVSAPQQPIYVIPSHPLHMNAMAGSVTASTTVLTQSLPVVNVRAITANHLRQTIESHSKSESLEVILPQKRPQISDTNSGQTSGVQHLIDKINSSNIPLIHIDPICSSPQSTAHSPNESSTQVVDSSERSSCASNPTSIVDNCKSVLIFESNKSEDKMISNSNTEKKSNISSLSIECIEVLNENNANEANESMSTTVIESSKQMPIISDQTISSLLEISLPEPPFSENSCSSLSECYSIAKRPFEKLTAPNSAHNNHMSDGKRTDPTLPSGSMSTSSSLTSPPIERHQKLSSPVPDSQWLNGESCDLSIGTLLNTCESPVKTVTVRDNHSLTNELNTQMSCLVTDNSVDLIQNFAALAAHIDSNSKST